MYQTLKCNYMRLFNLILISYKSILYRKHTWQTIICLVLPFIRRKMIIKREKIKSIFSGELKNQKTIFVPLFVSGGGKNREKNRKHHVPYLNLIKIVFQMKC